MIYFHTQDEWKQNKDPLPPNKKKKNNPKNKNKNKKPKQTNKQKPKQTLSKTKTTPHPKIISYQLNKID